MPRAYTPEECREMFLDHVRGIVKFWKEDLRNSREEALEGVAFSIMVLLDGGTELPGFKVIPNPHPDDKDYHILHKENYWPDDCDIRRDYALHEEFYRPEKK